MITYNVAELYSQLTLNDIVTARPPSIVRETFNPSSLWGAAMRLVSSSGINMYRARASLVIAFNIEHKISVTPSAPQRLDGLNVSLTMEGRLAVTMSFNVS